MLKIPYPALSYPLQLVPSHFALHCRILYTKCFLLLHGLIFIIIIVREELNLCFYIFLRLSLLGITTLMVTKLISPPLSFPLDFVYLTALEIFIYMSNRHLKERYTPHIKISTADSLVFFFYCQFQFSPFY